MTWLGIAIIIASAPLALWLNWLAHRLDGREPDERELP